MFVHIIDASIFKILIYNITDCAVELFKRCRLNIVINYEQANCYQLISNAEFFASNSWMNHRDQRSWKNKFMKNIIVVAATYAIFVKETFIITFKDAISIIDSNSQIINEALIFVISTKIFIILTEIFVISTKSILLISIEFLLKRVLFNDITVYDIKTVTSQLIIAMYDYLNIWKDQKITVDISEAEWMSIFIKLNVSVKAARVYFFD